jgi:hypothetical protein
VRAETSPLALQRPRARRWRLSLIARTCRHANPDEGSEIMSRSVIAPVFALAIAGILAPSAQAQHRRTGFHSYATKPMGGAQRSYLDPGTSAVVGSENRYFSDVAPYSYRQLGPSFSSDSFNGPGEADPWFRF